MSNKLNNDDIETLMEALDALESKHMRDGLMGSMFSMMLSKDKEEAHREADKEMAKAKAMTDSIRDKVILLKAKLIGLKDQETVNEVSEFLRQQKKGGNV